MCSTFGVYFASAIDEMRSILAVDYELMTYLEDIFILCKIFVKFCRYMCYYVKCGGNPMGRFRIE